MKRFYIKTYGCQMNFYDSEKIMALLAKNGYDIVPRPEDADIIAVNTCSVRKHAEDRALSFLSSYKHLKKEGKILCLLGCTAGLYKDAIYKKYGFIDVVCNPNNYNKLPEVLPLSSQKKICLIEEDGSPFISEQIVTHKQVSSFVTVTKGCENFCSYCVVPFTRGKLISKKPEDICREIKNLIEKGIREIILLGQNVNEYGKDTGDDFPSLLEKINNIDGLLRFGFLTSHPKDIADTLILAFQSLPKLYKHLHLPLQSGSDRILQLMNRRYSLAQYMKIIDTARKTAPNITITSDIITGFPSETKDDFNKTVQTIKNICFDDLFVFKYSARPLTKSSAMEDDVPEEEKRERHKTILDFQEEIALKRNQRFIGEVDNVFVIKPAHKKRGCFLGKSSTNKTVMFTSPHSRPGTLEKVTITSADRRYLFGDSSSGN